MFEHVSTLNYIKLQDFHIISYIFHNSNTPQLLSTSNLGCLRLHRASGTFAQRQRPPSWSQPLVILSMVSCGTTKLGQKNHESDWPVYACLHHFRFIGYTNIWFSIPGLLLCHCIILYHHTLPLSLSLCGTAGRCQHLACFNDLM